MSLGGLNPFGGPTPFGGFPLLGEVTVELEAEIVRTPQLLAAYTEPVTLTASITRVVSLTAERII